MQKHQAKDPNAFEKGRADALREIEAGQPRFYAGTRGKWGQFMVELFQFKFGVKVEHIDCFTTSELQSYRGGFNATIAEHIDRKHGTGAFDKALAEVTQFRKDYYASTSDQVTQEVLDHLDEG